MKINSYAAMKMTQLYKTGGGIQNTLKEYIDNAWSESNPNAVYPRMTIVDNNTNMKASDAYVKKGDFLKIANIQIGYTFPKRWLQPLRMDNARIFGLCQRTSHASPAIINSAIRKSVMQPSYKPVSTVAVTPIRVHSHLV